MNFKKGDLVRCLTNHQFVVMILKVKDGKATGISMTQTRLFRRGDKVCDIDDKTFEPHTTSFELAGTKFSPGQMVRNIYNPDIIVKVLDVSEYITPSSSEFFGDYEGTLAAFSKDHFIIVH